MSSRAFRRISQSLDNANPEVVDDDLSENITRRYFPKFEFTPEIPVVEEEDKVIHELECKSKKKKKAKKKNTHKILTHASSVAIGYNDPDTPVVECSLNSVSDLLAVKSKFLDPSLELARLFKSGMPEQDHRHQRPSYLKRGPLVRIKSSWPPVVKLGLDMDKLSNGSYTITHSREYQRTQVAFYEALNTMDPQSLTHVLADCPYHIDSLLQLSDIFVRQDNSELGLDLLERVLHAYQSVFHPCFNPTTGLCRLDYKYQANRGLFVALFRYAMLNGSRGCYQCALDYCKVLLSLDVAHDPMAVLLMIDHYALLSGQWNFLIQLYERLNPSKNLYLLPNFALSVALATRWKEKSPSGTESADLLLQDALIMFPGFLTRLLKHTTIGGVSNLDKSTLFGTEVQKESPSLGRLLDLYVARSHRLWTAPEVLSWLESNVTAVLCITEPKSVVTGNVDPRLSAYSERRRSLYPNLPRNILRHLVLSDFSDAPPFFPQGQSPRSIYCFDPLPPDNSIDIYNPDAERHHTDGSNGSILSSFVLSLLPGYSFQNGPSTPDQHADGAGTSDSAIRQSFAAAADFLASQIRRILELRPSNDSGSRANDDATNEDR